MLASRAARAAAAAIVTAMAALTALAPAASAAPAAAGRPGHLPPGAWNQLQSDLNAVSGEATGQGVTIALLSTGVDTSVVGLASRVTSGPDYIFQPQVPLSHTYGTLMATLFAGAPGVPGLASGARILSLRVEPDPTEPGYKLFYYEPPSDPQQAIAQAVRYAVGHGAEVIAIDDSFQTPEPEMLDAVRYALSRNVVVVAPEDSQTSAPGPDYVYPAGVAGVIGVSAIAFPGWTAPYSENPMEANNSVLISAPSNSELMPPDGYEIDGSAVAVPFVAATAALIKERWPRIPPALVARAIAMSARDRPSGGYSQSEGFGVLDPYDAVLDAGKVAGLTATAPAGAPGTVAASARFGDGSPPGVISALPSARPWYLVSGPLVVAGAAVLAGAVALDVRRRPRRAPAPPPAQPAQHPGGWSGPLRTLRYSSLRSRNRSFMLASIFTRPATQARAMFIGDSASDTTSSLFAVSLMSAGGSSGPISRTCSSPEPSLVPNVTPRSGIVTLIVWLPKYASRSAGFSSDSLLASFCSASRHCSAEFMCASFLNGRYRSRGG